MPYNLLSTEQPRDSGLCTLIRTTDYPSLTRPSCRDSVRLTTSYQMLLSRCPRALPVRCPRTRAQYATVRPCVAAPVSFKQPRVAVNGSPKAPLPFQTAVKQISTTANAASGSAADAAGQPPAQPLQGLFVKKVAGKQVAPCNVSG